MLSAVLKCEFKENEKPVLTVSNFRTVEQCFLGGPGIAIGLVIIPRSRKPISMLPEPSIGHVFVRFVIPIDHEQLSLLITVAPLGHWQLYACLIIFLILLKLAGRCLHVSEWHLWNNFRPPIQKSWSIVQMLHICLSLDEHVRSRVKILAVSDTESDCAMRFTWVLSPHIYMSPLMTCTWSGK